MVNVYPNLIRFAYTKNVSFEYYEISRVFRSLGIFGLIMQRYEIYYVVAAVWTIEIAWSHVWLKYFRFGPLEWLWRSLTYWKKQSLKR
ncbi:MAG: DUF418 domain-containing protein [Bacteroidetes bacterium]|nr:MAG: DUF418 domain-containing protein [Bacteroidota bacterium]